MPSGGVHPPWRAVPSGKRLEFCVARSPVDLSGPRLLNVVVGLFETRHQFGRDESALIRLEFEGLLQDMVGSVGHVAILLF